MREEGNDKKFNLRTKLADKNDFYFSNFHGVSRTLFNSPRLLPLISLKEQDM